MGSLSEPVKVSVRPQSSHHPGKGGRSELKLKDRASSAYPPSRTGEREKERERSYERDAGFEEEDGRERDPQLYASGIYLSLSTSNDERAHRLARGEWIAF